MVSKKGDWLPFRKMATAVSFRVRKLQLPSLQRAAQIPLRQAKGIQATLCNYGGFNLPAQKEATVTIIAKGRQCPLWQSVAAEATAAGGDGWRWCPAVVDGGSS